MLNVYEGDRLAPMWMASNFCQWRNC